MLFQRFLETISKFVPHSIAPKELEALAMLNPDKFYLENVRALLGVSSSTAQRICDTAVRQGAFRRLIEVVCPNGSVAAVSEDESKLPEAVRCWSELDGNYEETTIPTQELTKTVFYRLNDALAPTEAHA